MGPTNIEPRRARWRMLTLGSTVWAPFAEHGWHPATVTGLGKNRGHRTVVHLSFETGGDGRRVAGELYWREPELNGKDKPMAAEIGDNTMGQNATDMKKHNASN
jgi:hypothetical protein